MSSMRVVVSGLLAALAVVAGGCGGSSQAGAGGEAAALLEPGALVYWETISDPDSDQWQQVEELLRRFPDGEKWLRMLREEVEKEAEGKVTWREIRDALGGRTAIAVYLESAEADPVVVGLMNPDDPDEATEVIRKLNETESNPDDRLVSRVVGDWVVASDKEASIDAALAAEGARALGDDESFTSALAELPEDALSRVWVDVATLVERFSPQLDEDEREILGTFGLDHIDFAGAWARADDDGARIAALAKGSSLEGLLGTDEPYTSKLLERVPDDAFAFVTFRGEVATRQLDQLKGNPLYRMGAREIEEFLGVTLEELAGIVEGEVALYARRGTPFPEFTLLLDAAEPDAARASADKVLRAVARRLQGEVTEAGGVTTARFGPLTVSVGTLDDLIVVTTSRGGIADLGSGGDKLPDRAAFTDALDAAEAPDSYTGLAWIDLAEAIELALGFAEASDEELPPEIRRNLEPLRSFVAYGTAGEDSAEISAFLGIE